MALSGDTEARLEALRGRGCRVVGPALEDHPAEGGHGEAVDWLCAIVLPDGEQMKGRGLSPEEAAVAAVSRAEGAPQLGLLAD